MGGGSPRDSAKAISIVSSNKGKTNEYLMGKEIKNPGAPILAIPTTSGTGTEVTEISVLSDRKKMIKKSIRSRFIYPIVALDDPLLTVTMPKKVTASTGLDALTHAIEAYTSTKSQPICDAICMNAVKIVLNNVTNAFDDGSNINARSNMMLASLMAGIGITHSGAGLAHGLSYSVWKITQIAHGSAVGILLPHVMKFNQDHVGEKYENLARFCSFKNTDELICKIQELRADLDLPDRLGDIGIKHDDVKDMIELGLGGSSKVNPRPVEPENLAEFIRGAI